MGATSAGRRESERVKEPATGEMRESKATLSDEIQLVSNNRRLTRAGPDQRVPSVAVAAEATITGGVTADGAPGASL